MEGLRSAYLELMMEEPGTPLTVFMERAARGAYGVFTAEETADFLRAVRRDIIAGITAQAAANPGLAAEAEDRMEEAQLEIDALLARYAKA